MINDDLQLIDDLLCLLVDHKNGGWAGLETQYHATNRAMRRLREAYERGEREVTTLGLANHFEVTGTKAGGSREYSSRQERAEHFVQVHTPQPQALFNERELVKLCAKFADLEVQIYREALREVALQRTLGHGLEPHEYAQRFLKLVEKRSRV